MSKHFYHVFLRPVGDRKEQTGRLGGGRGDRIQGPISFCKRSGVAPLGSRPGHLLYHWNLSHHQMLTRHLYREELAVLPVTDRQYLAVLVDITKLCWTEVRLLSLFATMVYKIVVQFLRIMGP
jgi:hypothetical protein